MPELPGHGLSSVDLGAALPVADLAAIVTAHPGIDYEAIAVAASLLVDFRGVTRGFEAENVIRL